MTSRADGIFSLLLRREFVLIRSMIRTQKTRLWGPHVLVETFKVYVLWSSLVGLVFYFRWKITIKKILIIFSKNVFKLNRNLILPTIIMNNI